MRSRLVIVRRLAMFGMLALIGCSKSQPAAPEATAAGTLSNCVVHLTGNLQSTLMLPRCGALSSTPSEAGTDDFALGFHFTNPDLPSLDISIALGPSPAPGSYSSEGSSAWSAAGLTAAQCRYSAGNESVPVGSFQLTLRSLEIADGGAGGGAGATSGTGTESMVANGGEGGTDAGIAAAGAGAADAGTESEPRSGSFHGTLQLTMYVEAPAATDCGIGDTENIGVDF